MLIFKEYNVDMKDDQFTKLFRYVEGRFDQLQSSLDSKSSQDSIDRLANTLDGFAKRIEENEVENAARDRQFERLLDWARKVSTKTGIPLENL